MKIFTKLLTIYKNWLLLWSRYVQSSLCTVRVQSIICLVNALYLSCFGNFTASPERHFGKASNHWETHRFNCDFEHNWNVTHNHRWVERSLHYKGRVPFRQNGSLQRTTGMTVRLLRERMILKSCIFWDISPCTHLKKVNRRFGWIFYIRFQSRIQDQARNQREAVKKMIGLLIDSVDWSNNFDLKISWHST
jgi:hypothetical protein